MKRAQLFKLLEGYCPSIQEADAKFKMVEFAKEHEDCLERSLLKGHFTSSAWLLNKDGSKALLMHHAKLNLWVQPGGHCDGDGDFLGVAIKEAQEESGIKGISPVKEDIFDIDILLVPEYKQIPAHFHYDVRFLLQVRSDEDAVLNIESKELRWVGKDRAELPTDEPSVVRMFNKWVENKSYVNKSSN